MSNEISDSTILDQYLKKLTKEAENNKVQLLELREKYRGRSLDFISKISKELPDLFPVKYYVSGCQELIHNEPLFVKSVVETCRLSLDVTSYLNQLTQDLLNEDA